MATGKGKAAARERGRAWGPGRRRTPGGATNPSAGRATCCAGRDPGGHPRQRPVPRPSAGAATLLAAARLLSPLRVGERRLPSPFPASSLPGGEDPPLGGPRPAPAPCPPPWSLKPSPKAQCNLAQLPGATHGPLHGPAAPLSVLSRRVGPQKLHAPPRGRSVQLWPHHVVGAGGLLMRWPGGCLGAAMALCMPSRPPERAGFGVPVLAVPPAADPRRLRLF